MMAAAAQAMAVVAEVAAVAAVTAMKMTTNTMTTNTTTAADAKAAAMRAVAAADAFTAMSDGGGGESDSGGGGGGSDSQFFSGTSLRRGQHCNINYKSCSSNKHQHSTSSIGSKKFMPSLLSQYIHTGILICYGWTVNRKLYGPKPQSSINQVGSAVLTW